MRLRRRFAENAGLVIVPTICVAVSLYFGYSGVLGPRGVIALHHTEAELSAAERDLTTIRGERQALQHRIALLGDKSLDPDLLEEVARKVLAQGRGDEVAVPREKH